MSKEKNKEIMNRLHGIGVIPAIVLNRVEDAAPLGEALVKGGLPAAEVTYRTDCAHDAMVAMKKACPELLVGAGTVLTTEQVDSAIDAGAEFIVAPGLNPKVVQYCIDKDIPVVPGVSNASDIEKALEFGLHTVKFFPAEQLGGIKTIKALCGPYTTMTFMPTGGVNEKNMNDYLNDSKIFAVGGTWMVKADLIKAGRFDEVERLSREAVLNMLQIKIKHIGINASNTEAEQIAKDYAKLFCGAIRTTSKGYFGSDLIEVVNEDNHTGTHGHIAMGVSSVERALYYFKSLGYEFDEDTITYDDNGYAKFAYFKQEIGGFKVHLVNNK